MTMPPEDVGRRLRAELDSVPVPERPWAAVRPGLIRRRAGRRGRKAASAACAVLAVIGAATALAVVLPVHGTSHRTAILPQRRRTSPTARPGSFGRIISGLRQPGALAVGPAGQLYIADDSRNQILQLLPGGKFRLVAGNGKAGFSGDGGPATSASLNDPGGMVVARSGTLYFADTGNNTIRAVSPSGVIFAVAGDGRPGGWVATGTPALRAGLLSPGDVTIGPDGMLYIADTGSNEILKLTPSGRLVVVAGARKFAGIWGIGRPATGASPDGPDGLAFDRSGDLFIAGLNTKTLLMITPGGIMTLPDGTDGFYPRGNGGLVTAPGGSVLAMNTQQVDRVTSHGIQVLYNLPSHPRIGISGAWASDGIAVAPDGTIYLDTWPNGFATKTALIEIKPDGTARVIWAA
jgi:sugar lactone lactonase YvrE